MNIDTIATAVDWLDAYRSGDLEHILEFFADQAVVECNCGDTMIVAGKEGLRAYWVQRLSDYPASELHHLQPAGDRTSISYLTGRGLVKAVLEFDAAGKITLLRCWQIAR
ncbi:nuclear transport factor 2 family protein [Bradyrhizobium sp. USDA 10063]